MKQLVREHTYIVVLITVEQQKERLFNNERDLITFDSTIRQTLENGKISIFFWKLAHIKTYQLFNSVTANKLL